MKLFQGFLAVLLSLSLCHCVTTDTDKEDDAYEKQQEYEDTVEDEVTEATSEAIINSAAY